MYSSVIFDFDGTICDTGIGVKKSAKYALDSFNIASEDWQDLDFFIGPPLMITFQEHYHQSAADAELLVKKYRERYTNVGLFESELYEGIEGLLKNLKADGVKIGIASSKPQGYIEPLLEKFNIASYFDVVCGVSFQADCESKQNIIARCVDSLGADIKQTLMVGDRFYDIDGANANSIDSVGVLWGYGNKFEFIESGAKYIIDKISDVESIALGLYERTDAVHGIFNGKIITVHNDDISHCDDSVSSRECVDHPGGVAVIGVTDDDEVLVVRQFRYPYKETIYEIPAGKLEKGEDPLEAGKREFLEECGAIADEYISLGEVYPTPGYTNEIIRLFFAKGLHFAEQNLDEGEMLEAGKMKFDILYQKVMSGEIKDAKTIIAVLKLKEMRNKL
jgi:phosphoglycolate phosphatase-like HAD superfamily hydrolase/8-oxo-dGTP pyrophosphatase MutT (NUDIX family)